MSERLPSASRTRYMPGQRSQGRSQGADWGRPAGLGAEAAKSGGSVPISAAARPCFCLLFQGSSVPLQGWGGGQVPETLSCCGSGSSPGCGSGSNRSAAGGRGAALSGRIPGRRRGCFDWRSAWRDPVSAVIGLSASLTTARTWASSQGRRCKWSITNDTYSPHRFGLGPRQGGRDAHRQGYISGGALV